MSIWFTADTHFSHANIIRFCNRPFKNVEEMDEKLIANWNQCIKPNDEVYHLGDFSFSGEPLKIARRLNGNKMLILGNHDRIKNLQKCGFGWIKDCYELRIDKKTKIWLSHYSHRAWRHNYRGVIHLYGHSHGQLEDYGKSTDIGVDCWDYKPVHLDVVLKMMEGRENIKHH